MAILRIIIIILPIPLWSQGFYGKAIKVFSGQSFTFLYRNDIHIPVILYGISCPYIGQPYAEEAKQYLTKLIFEKEVDLAWVDEDIYGRKIGIITVNNININEEMIRAGFAWHNKEQDYNPEWAKLETEAKIAKRGLWSQPNPIPPWEWRAKN